MNEREWLEAHANAAVEDVEDLGALHRLAASAGQIRLEAVETLARLMGRHDAATVRDLLEQRVIGHEDIEAVESVLSGPGTTRDAFDQVHVTR